jgi:hypothetical protein
MSTEMYVCLPTDADTQDGNPLAGVEEKQMIINSNNNMMVQRTLHIQKAYRVATMVIRLAL